MAFEYNPYVILGVGPNAAVNDIKRAYRKLAQRLHPDKSPYLASQQQFQMVNDAHNLLLDPTHRKRFDDWYSKKADHKGFFTLRSTPSRRAIMALPDEQVVYLLAEIMAAPPATDEESNETNLNIALVIDQSKSMGDYGWMPRVLAAAQSLIMQLKDKDILSVVSFNDKPTVIIDAQSAANKNQLVSHLSTINAEFGTEMYKGLLAGVNQVRKYKNDRMVNHVILLTDGHTFGDDDDCLTLAQKAKDEGIGISTMGLGTDWNDAFLDELASITGGNSVYIRTLNDVKEFLDTQVRSLSDVYAERVQLSIAPDPGIELEMAFRLAPTPQRLPHENGVIQLGGLQAERATLILMQFQLPGGIEKGYHSVVRLVASGEIMQSQQKFHAVSDLALEVTDKIHADDAPPPALVDALSKLALFKLQEDASVAAQSGDINAATRRLEYLATRLMGMGERELGRQALAEATHMKQTIAFSSKEAQLNLKYSTRSLAGGEGLEKAITSMLGKTGS